MEKESMSIFADGVCELSGSVVELSRYYTMAWVVLKAYYKKDFENVIRFHPDFMDTFRDAVLQSFFITTYRLFDKNTKAKVKTFRNLLNIVAPVDPPLVRQLIAKIDSKDILVRKMFQIRHKLYAHRDGAHRPWEAAGTIKRQEMKAVVSLSWDIISGLSDLVVSKMGHALEVHKIEILKGVKQRNRRRIKFANLDAREVLTLLKEHGRK